MSLIYNNISYDLSEVRSGSGTKYESANGVVSWWEHQGQATLVIAGEAIMVSSITSAELLTFTVAAEPKKCAGVGQHMCLLVNDQLFYDPIQGFDYVAGTEYELLVARSLRAAVPADASAYTYHLVKVISINGKENDIFFDSATGQWKDKYGICNTCSPENGFETDGTLTTGTKTGTTGKSTQVAPTSPILRYSPEGTSWTYNGGTLGFKDGRYSMNFGCNQLSGTFTVERTVLTFTSPISTRKACPADVAEKENQFVAVISTMDTFTETAVGARLTGKGEKLVLE